MQSLSDGRLEDFNKKKTVDFGDTDEVEIGDYFNFHNHSIFHLLQSTTSIEDLINRAKSDNFPAVGMVDLGNMMGAFKFISEVENYNSKVKKAHQEYIEQKQKSRGRRRRIF